MSKQYTTPVARSGEKNKLETEFVEKVVQIDRVSRTVKGGRRIRFRVLVVVGDRNGKVGYGIGKASEISGAISKAVIQAKKNFIKIPIHNDTIKKIINIKIGASHILLKPAKLGTSVIAGGAVRAVIDAVGIKNILTKIIGTNNKLSNVKTTIKALSTLIED